MENAAIIKACGVEDLAIASDDRPIVSFVLIAFNQEQYIRQAVEGAFSQTYSPLEIILSDDCSSDHTFEIMQEMAAAYDGPHTVRARRNKVNVGTLAHIQELIAGTSGQLIVLAAGDDISRRNRVEKLYSSWKAHNSSAVFSSFAEIDECGRITANNKRNGYISSPSYRLRSYMRGSAKASHIVHGATSAYDRSVFDYVVLPDDDYILSEDGALSILLHILSLNVSFIDEPLVEYRKHDESLTNSTNRSLSWKRLSMAEDRIATFARSQTNRCQFIIETHHRFIQGAEERIDIELVKRDLNKQKVVANWWKMSMLQRIFALLATDVQFAKWAVPRIIPRAAFISLKYLRGLVRRMSVY